MVADIDSDVDLHRPARADRIDLAFLQRAQELDLRVEGEFADFVQKKRPAVRLCELADMFLGRAGEGALLVAEQDQLDQRLGQRATIDGDERLASPFGAALDRARHQLLADAGFAFDEDGNVRLRGALGEPHRARHQFGAADNVAKAEFARCPARGAPQLVLERVDPERVLDRHLEPLRADRLDDEIDRACAHRGNDRLDRAMRRLDNGGNRYVALAHAGEHAHAVEIGHHQIENEEIDRLLVIRLQPCERGLTGLERLDLVAEPLRHRLQKATLDGIVIDNKDEGGHRESWRLRRCFSARPATV